MNPSVADIVSVALTSSNFDEFKTQIGKLVAILPFESDDHTDDDTFRLGDRVTLRDSKDAGTIVKKYTTPSGMMYNVSWDVKTAVWHSAPYTIAKAYHPRNLRKVEPDLTKTFDVGDRVSHISNRDAVGTVIGKNVQHPPRWTMYFVLFDAEKDSAPAKSYFSYELLPVAKSTEDKLNELIEKHEKLRQDVIILAGEMQHYCNDRPFNRSSTVYDWQRYFGSMVERLRKLASRE